MNLIKFLLVLLLLIFSMLVHAQTGTLKGVVVSAADNQPIPFADVVLENTSFFTSTDEDGKFTLTDIAPGVYNLKVVLIGYEEFRLSEISINPVRTQNIEVTLTENLAQLDEVIVKTSSFRPKAESPTSVTSIGVTEILRSPGANRDISFVVRNIPGVATTNSFRNDLIVRGGAPSENSFFMDGIEIPNINHFATQGSSGGPVGMLNVNFIQQVDFYTGAFPVNKGDALSSVMDIYTKNANPDRMTGSITVGSSDFGLTLDMPTGKNSGMLLSVRRSYLQFLFEQLKLPFLPTYNDFQYAHKITLNDKNQLKILGLGAIDNFKLNAGVNDGVTDAETLERNTYILNNIPKYEQWNYTVGVNWRLNVQKGYHETVLSRNMLNNTAEKYLNNVEIANNKLYDYQSQEIENKLRYEYHHTSGKWKWYAGFGLQNVSYNNTTFQKITIGENIQTLDFDSKITFQKYALFAQTSPKALDDKLNLSLSIRSDFSDYSQQMSNPFEQLSPRISLSYQIADQHKITGSLGRYFQLPSYTILGFRNTQNTLVNKENKVRYLQSWQFVTGYQWTPKDYFQLKIESFYKKYNNYPYSIYNGISLANLGSDFGVIGNTPVTSSSKGKSYGLEISGIQKLTQRIFGSFSYTFVRSLFENNDDNYVPSSWDNKHIINILGGYKFNKNWELGAKFRLLGGAPYTPYDLENSSLQTVWDVNQQGVLDYGKLNSERLNLSHGLDVRLDKKWYFKHWSLNAYLDLQNIYNAKVKNPPYFNVIYDADGTPLVSESNPNSYQYHLIENESGTVLPSIGIMIDF